MLTGTSFNLGVRPWTHGFLKSENVYGSLYGWAYLRDC